MIQSYSRGRFEFFVVATVIALLFLMALDRYTIMTKDARVLRLEIISHHFMVGAANLRTEFLLSPILTSPLQVHKGLMVDGQLVYVSDEGWPVSATTPVTSAFQLTDNDCYQLWRILLQNPDPIVVGKVNRSKQYRAFVNGGSCRYTMADGEAYFDYFPLTGRLLFSAINK